MWCRLLNDFKIFYHGVRKTIPHLTEGPCDQFFPFARIRADACDPLLCRGERTVRPETGTFFQKKPEPT
jgi:hypothetical protein